jgi:LacI family transcriptional regulator
MINNQGEITIRDLAKMLSLSTATVSRALNNDPMVRPQTKKRVLKLAGEIGYRVNDHARMLKNNRSRILGCIVPRLDCYFVANMVSGMEKSAGEANYSLVIMQSNETSEGEALCANALYNRMVDGLFVVVSENTKPDHFAAFIQRNVPVILLNGAEETPPYINIAIDHAKAGYEITRHFLEQGREFIIYITGQGRLSTDIERLKGYGRAFQEAGIIIGRRHILNGGISWDEGAKVAESILQWRQRPDAIIATSDECAAGCISILKSHGVLIPEEIAVAGFGNDPISQVTQPTLTTVHYPARQMGESAVREFMFQLDGSVSNKHVQSILLRSDLIVRQSG